MAVKCISMFCYALNFSARIPNKDKGVQGKLLADSSPFYSQFVELVGLDTQPFHIIGLSMGGAIALNYSGTYQKNVAGASIICPASKF